MLEDLSSSLSFSFCLATLSNHTFHVRSRCTLYPSSSIRFRATGRPCIISVWRMNTPTVRVHGWVRKKGSNPPIKQTPRIGKEGREIMKVRKGKDMTRSVSRCGVYGDGGRVTEWGVDEDEGLELVRRSVTAGEGVKWDGWRCRWYVYGSINANRSALLIECFIRRKRKESKKKDDVAHVAPIRFWIPCILACQGIGLSAWGIDDGGVFSTVQNKGSEDEDSGYGYVANIIPIIATCGRSSIKRG